ncbi:MAG: DNA translocase FtsK, partial [Bacteroidales bacterium]|nr:DNA translocase FtsK [Bacteroidales bacterium]
MTKRRTKKTEPSAFSRIWHVITGEDCKRVVGLAICFVTLYVLFATTSYFFTGASDQSSLGQYETYTAQIAEARGEENALKAEMDEKETEAEKAVLSAKLESKQSERRTLEKARQSACNKIENWCGYRGAVLADRLMNGTFGISTFFLLAFPLLLSFSLIFSQKNRRISLVKIFICSVVFAVWGSLLMAFLFYHVIQTDGFLNLGGNYGIETTQWLINNIGMLGTLLLLVGSGLVFIVLTCSSLVERWLSVFDKKKTPSLAEEAEVEDGVSQGFNPFVDNTDQNENTNEDDARWPLGEQSTEELTEALDHVTTEIFVPQSDTDEAVDTGDSTQDAIVDIPIISTDTTIQNSDEENEIDTDTESGDTANVNLNKEESVPYDPLKELGPYDPRADLPTYQFPNIDLLKDYPSNSAMTEEEKIANRNKIISTLANFKIGIKQIYETIGPTVTLYEIVPEQGVMVNKFKRLEDDIMLSLKATGIRIIAPIPGKGTIGIEVPNENPTTVSMRSVIASKKFQECKYELPVAIGRTITNEVYTFDLCKMPHLLVAGATGQGKSVGLNAIITSLLYKKHPAELKFVLVDPKKVEFSIYSEIERHYLAELPESEEPVITDVDRVKQTLNSICKEMDMRYNLLKMVKARNIREYNEKFIARKLNPNNGHHYLPYIVVVIDEFGDLIMTAGREVEMPIARIAQLARAVGIHMIIATQRPSVNIITGTIKANFPARIAFRVMTAVDSKTILDASGANRLVGKGDMLFTNGNEMTRIQCAFVDTPEVEKVVEHVSNQTGYPQPFYLPECDEVEATGSAPDVDMSKRDSLFDEVARYVVANQRCSATNIQFKYGIGFVRA